mgnify:CR=1 FL=1
MSDAIEITPDPSDKDLYCVFEYEHKVKCGLTKKEANELAEKIREEGEEIEFKP